MPKQTPIYKYKLREMTNNMTREQYTDFYARFPEVVGATVRSFYNWAEIPFADPRYIPDDILAKIATLMGLSGADELKNFEIVPKPQPKKTA